MPFHPPSPAARPCALLALAATFALGACADRNPAAPAPPAAAAFRSEASASQVAGTPIADGVIILGTLGGTRSWTSDVNDAGQVVGTSETAARIRRGFVWTPEAPGASTGVMQELGTLGGSTSWAHGINEAGYIVGMSLNAAGRERATLWVPGAEGGYTPVDLGVIASPGLTSYAYGISEAGHVTGVAHNALRQTRAFLWTPSSPGATTGTMQDLGTLGGTRSYGRAVNSDGWVAGESSTSNGRVRAFLWTSASGLVDLGVRVEPYGNSSAVGINEAGQVVGNGYSEGWTWTPSSPGVATGGTLRKLGRYFGARFGTSTAIGINDSGQVAGWFSFVFTNPYTNLWIPVVRPADGDYQDLYSPDTVAYATAISNNGNVAGEIEVAGSDNQAAVWLGPALRGLPRAVLRGAASGTVRRRYVLDASASSHSHGRATFRWDLDGDGIVDRSTGDTPTVAHTFPSTGTHRVRVVVRDRLEREDTAEMNVSIVANVPPVAQITGVPEVWPEGALLGPAFTVSDANPEDSAFTYRWYWGDGTSSATPVKRYGDQGRYEIRLVVRDGGGLADTAVIHADVVNAPPTASVSVPASTYEGAPYAVTVSSPSDPGTADRATLQFAFDCGRGEGYGAFSTTRAATCPALADQDTFNARAKVRDKDGAETEYVRTVRVVNARPVVQAQLADSGAPQGPAAFRFTDGGVADGPWQYRVRRGNGTYTAWMPATPGTWITTPAYAYPSGSHAETVYVRDKDGAIGYSAPVTLSVP